MKRILAVALIATMVTGCANTSSQAKTDEPSFGAKLLCANGLCSAEVTEWNNKKMFEAARSDCVRMGFSVSSQQFPQCVQNQVISARNRQTAENNARRIASAQAASAAEMTRLNQPVHQVDQGYRNYRNYDCQRRIGGRVECTGY
jgi:hypothetical protein